MTDALDAELATPHEAHPRHDPRDEARRRIVDSLIVGSLIVGSLIVGSPGPLGGVGPWAVRAPRSIDRPPRVPAGLETSASRPPASASERSR